MLLFKKILNFKAAGGLGDKRGATRYPVGAKFPLKAKVTLVGRDGNGNILKADDRRAMDWGGQLVNMLVPVAAVHPLLLPPAPLEVVDHGLHRGAALREEAALEHDAHAAARRAPCGGASAGASGDEARPPRSSALFSSLSARLIIGCSRGTCRYSTDSNRAARAFTFSERAFRRASLMR